MKFAMKLALAVAALICATQTSFAQPKFGYVNSQEIIFAMPEIQQVQLQLEQLEKDLSEQLEFIQVEYNKLYTDYQQKAATYSDAIRQSKEQELVSLQQRYEELGKAGSAEMQTKQAELMKPVIDKAKAAIDKIAAEGGYVFVFDMATGSLAYWDENQMTDLAPMVKKELGITDAPAAEAAPAQ